MLKIFNADETGCQTSEVTSKKILCSSTIKRPIKVTGATKTSITTLHCICGDGSAIPPSVLFSGKNLNAAILSAYPENYFFGVTEKGWIDTATFYGWVANHFLPNITDKRPVLLLVDGHTTHIDVHTAKLCKQNNVVLYLLHAHASHLIQPCDREYFKTFKSVWANECSAYRNRNPGKGLNKSTFSEVFVPTYDKTVSRHVIISSFKNSGIWPINPDAIDYSNCKPAKVTL